MKFLHLTGMRSGQAKAITRDMIDDDDVLHMPGVLTKNGLPYSLSLTNKKGEPYDAIAFVVDIKTRRRRPVFDMTNLREEWRMACAQTEAWNVRSEDAELSRRATSRLPAHCCDAT